MRIATEVCHRCSAPVFEEDINSRAAVDELARCLCPRCSTQYLRIAVPAPARRIALETTPPLNLLRLAVLLFAILALSALLLKLMADKPVSGMQETGGEPLQTSPVPSKIILSDSQVERLQRAVAQQRLRRAVSDERLYRETRDKALELMSSGQYAGAAEVIEQYPEELRGGDVWETRLAPLWREATRLSHATEAYSQALSEAAGLAGSDKPALAAGILRDYAASFPDTAWAREASRRADLLTGLQNAKSVPEPEPSKKPDRTPAPPPVVRPNPSPEPKPEPELKKPPMEDEFKKKIKTAISRGAKYVLAAGNHDGSFKSSYSRSYPAGPASLALLALLKCGADRNSAIITKSFNRLSKIPLNRTYSVSLYMLALEARFEPHGDEIKPDVPFDEQLRKRFTRYASGSEKRLVRSIVAWLRDAQCGDGTWSYTGRTTSSPGITTMGRGRMSRGQPSGDGSNTQFAVLALYGAHRLGATIPKETVSKLSTLLLETQQKSGPAVKSFPVPAADLPISRIRREEKKALGRKDGPHTVSVDELYGGGTRPSRMYARGWSYASRLRSHAYLSMTCAGVCNMVLAKAVLEGQSDYRRSSAKVDQAIRDGAAFISKYLESYLNTHRVGGLGWGLFYTLYSVERAGMLTLCEKFGNFQWYKEGAQMLLGLQGRNGSWGNCLEDTCFALLFLSRSTTPLIRTSGTIYTGPDLFPRKKK